MISSSLPDRLSTKVRAIEDVFTQRGVAIRSMKKAGSLETLAGVDSSNDTPPSRLFELERLEGAIAPRAIARIQPNATRFRYFLDATQKTLPVWRIGLVPIVVTYAVTGILERDDSGESLLLPGSLADSHVWLIPKHTGVPVIDDLIAHLEDHEEKVIDPIAEHPRSHQFDYESVVGEFNRIVDCAYATAGEHRALLERDALRKWHTNPERRFPDGWMVVDGRLGDNHPNCIGLVKQLLTQHLRGAEAEVLFDLESGHRTTAFRLLPSNQNEEDPGGRTQWYMRFWNADGFEARHALVRIEAPQSVDTTEEIDEIASWIYAERLPRATDDPRWPTLLYPIHFLERILKRKLATITAGWPS